MTTCPSGVNYMHLVDHARHRIETTYRRPCARPRDAPRPRRPSCRGHGCFARPCRRRGSATPLAALLPKRIGVALSLVPRACRRPRPSTGRRPFPAKERGGGGSRCSAAAPSRFWRRRSTRRRSGSSPVTAARWSSPRARLLRRAHPSFGQDVTPSPRPTSWPGRARSRHGGLDAIVVNASGCGTTVKDYGFLFRNDPELAAPAARGLGARPRRDGARRRNRPARARDRGGRRVAYHSACSLQHGQRVPRRAEGAPESGRLRRARSAGGPPVLRLGRDLQPPAAGHRDAVCATGRSRTSRASRPTSSPPATSAVSRRSRARRRCRSSTRSSFSTGRPEGRGRGESPALIPGASVT